jgi:hypothetical protein
MEDRRMKALVPTLIALALLGGCSVNQTRSLSSPGGPRIYGDPVVIYPGVSQTYSRTTTVVP